MADMDKAMRFPDGTLDPKYKYTWVLDEPKTQSVYRMGGYEEVKATDPDAAKIKEFRDPRLATDGKIRIGDAILMRRPKEIAEAEDKERSIKHKKAVSNVRENFHAEAASLGLPSFDEDKP